ncbi:hypothetical protein [Pseudobacillus badius]|uniref:hypothetical protein n=1 Tax=Bacillus badius TaxID=1455 RepID=UPI001CBBF701|nr:hypothetical protein [Bacillus badius]UAT28982.1 hypothetical protein K7T73_10100 [Bacillus badius]GLY12901.1 hypothetical protein Bbad01_41170 [Bacillus badius]
MTIMGRSMLVLFITFIMGFYAVQLVIITTDLEPGEKIGEDWYLIKSHEKRELKEGNEVYIETSVKHGTGTIYLPLIAGAGVALLHFVTRILKK